MTSRAFDIRQANGVKGRRAMAAISSLDGVERKNFVAEQWRASWFTEYNVLAGLSSARSAASLLVTRNRLGRASAAPAGVAPLRYTRCRSIRPYGPS